MKKGLRWIPRHLEVRKGVVSDEMQELKISINMRISDIDKPFKLLLNPQAGKPQPSIYLAVDSISIMLQPQVIGQK